MILPYLRRALCCALAELPGDKTPLGKETLVASTNHSDREA